MCIRNAVQGKKGEVCIGSVGQGRGRGKTGRARRLLRATFEPTPVMRKVRISNGEGYYRALKHGRTWLALWLRASRGVKPVKAWCPTWCRACENNAFTRVQRGVRWLLLPEGASDGRFVVVDLHYSTLIFRR